MITVTMLCENGDPIGFHITGHAMCGAYGEDVVCAAVSAVVQTAILGITDVLSIECGFSLDKGDAYCIVDRNTPKLKLEQVTIVLRTMEAGINSILSLHPGTYNIKYKEV